VDSRKGLEHGPEISQKKADTFVDWKLDRPGHSIRHVVETVG
jgi:hypothetical protein